MMKHLDTYDERPVQKNILASIARRIEPLMGDRLIKSRFDDSRPSLVVHRVEALLERHWMRMGQRLALPRYDIRERLASSFCASGSRRAFARRIFAVSR
jgi:hypothetical protein